MLGLALHLLAFNACVTLSHFYVQFLGKEFSRAGAEMDLSRQSGKVHAFLEGVANFDGGRL